MSVYQPVSDAGQQQSFQEANDEYLAMEGFRVAEKAIAAWKEDGRHINAKL